MATGVEKQRLFAVSTRIPFVGETADPWIFSVLALLSATTAFGVAFASDIFPHDKDARSHVIQLAAGMLVVLGAYFTAVNIREARAQQAFDRLVTVVDKLASDSPAVQPVALCLLESIMSEKLDLPGSHATAAIVRARRRAVVDALDHLVQTAAVDVVARRAVEVRSGLLQRGIIEDLEVPASTSIPQPLDPEPEQPVERPEEPGA